MLRQVLCCFLSIMMSVLLPLEAPCAPPQQGLGGITGVVRDDKGDVVPEARVTLIRQGYQTEELVRSGAAGQFTFQSKPEGNYIVTVAKPGFALLRLDGIVVKPGQSTEIQPVLSNGLKSQMASIPAGKVVVVKLKQEGSKKITGKLGPVTDDGFEIQTVKSGRVSSEKIAFADVDSLKKRGMSTAATVGIGVGLATGVAFLVIVAALAKD